MKKILSSALLCLGIMFSAPSNSSDENTLRILKQDGKAHPDLTLQGLDDCVLVSNLYRKYLNNRIANPNILASEFLNEYPLYKDIFSQEEWNKFIRFVADNPTHQPVYSHINGKDVFTGNLNSDTRGLSLAMLKSCSYYANMSHFVSEGLPIILDTIKEKLSGPIYMD